MTPARSTWQRNLVGMVITMTVITMRPQAGAGKFYADDPLRTEIDGQDASRVRPTGAASGWASIRPSGDRSDVHALNVNSIDEVPDSNWFTNRIGTAPFSAAAIAQGPDTLSPRPAGPWTVTSGKTDGVTPGLQMTDAAGRRFFVKFDPPANPEMASGAEVVATKLLFALGYNVPENYIASVTRDDLVLGPGASFKGPDGRKRPMTAADVDRVLQRAARQADGTYRIVASLAVEGTPIGPFQYSGTRADDPNDIVPHEHRRELRALRVFAAWLNHVDTKSLNSLDTLVPSGRIHVARHYLIDFGSALGSGGTEPKDWRDGHEYGFDKRTSMLALLSLGTYTPPWTRIHYPHLPAVGRIESDHFDPTRWKPTLPNPAFQNLRADDAFWAARRVIAFSDAALREVVATARFSDPAAAQYLTEVLIRRRDAIGATYLAAVNPTVDPSIDRMGRLTFANAAADRGVAANPGAYEVTWSVFDNTTHDVRPIETCTSVGGAPWTVPSNLPSAAQFIVAHLAAIDAKHPSWAIPVRAYFRRAPDRLWTLVGFERPQSGNEEAP